MVRVSERFLQQITLLAKEGSLTVDASMARGINAADPIDPQDWATKKYVDDEIAAVPLSATLSQVLGNGDETGGENINFTSGSQILSDDYLEINTDTRIFESFFAKGLSVGLYSDELNVESNYIFLGQNYTTTSAQTGGFALNYQATGTTTTVGTGGFTAGVAAASNPTVRTVGLGTFATGDLIMISGANKETNDGLYEVLSHSGTLLTVRGVGTTGTDQDFTSEQFETDTTATGTVTKVNVSILRSGTDGLWEVAQGSTTTLFFNDLVTNATGIPPTGPAGGDLASPAPANNYPNPLVKGFTTSAGTGTQLSYGAIADGELLLRQVNDVVGISPSNLIVDGQAVGTLGSTAVLGGTFGGVPLTFSSVTDGEVLVRSGSTIVSQPASGTPTGSAGGDLDGYYPDPEVVAAQFDIDRLTFGSVADGEVLVRSGSEIISQPASGTPTGSAGGDLDGYYPDPEVVAAQFNTTRLTFGTVADTELLIRSGSDVIGVDPTSLVVAGDVTGTLAATVVNSADFDGETLSFDNVEDGYLLQRISNNIIGVDPESLGGGIVVSVLSYGATGDGVTDDTAAIRDAVAATPTGGTLWFPPGTYVVDFSTERLALRGDIRILGYGATISGYILADIDGDNITVEGIALEGTTSTTEFAKLDSTSANRRNDVVFRNVHFVGGGPNPWIRIRGDRFRVLGCRFDRYDDGSADGVSFGGFEYHGGEGLYVEDTVCEWGTKDDMFVIKSITERTDGIHFRNVTVRGSSGVLAIGTQVQLDVTNVTVTDCIAHSCSAVVMARINNASYSGGTLRGLTITGCTLFNKPEWSAGQGFAVDEDDPRTTKAQMRGYGLCYLNVNYGGSVRDVTVHGCHRRGRGSDDGGPLGGLLVAVVDSGTIDSVRISGCTHLSDDPLQTASSATYPGKQLGPAVYISGTASTTLDAVSLESCVIDGCLGIVNSSEQLDSVADITVRNAVMLSSDYSLLGHAPKAVGKIVSDGYGLTGAGISVASESTHSLVREVVLKDDPPEMTSYAITNQVDREFDGAVNWYSGVVRDSSDDTLNLNDADLNGVPDAGGTVEGVLTTGLSGFSDGQLIRLSVDVRDISGTVFFQAYRNSPYFLLTFGTVTAPGIYEFFGTWSGTGVTGVKVRTENGGHARIGWYRLDNVTPVATTRDVYVGFDNPAYVHKVELVVDEDVAADASSYHTVSVLANDASVAGSFDGYSSALTAGIPAEVFDATGTATASDHADYNYGASDPLIIRRTSTGGGQVHTRPRALVHYMEVIAI